MKKELLRDRAGRVIGQRDSYEENPSRQAMRDRAGKLVGYFDAANNITRDRAGRLVGKGDLTVGLLKKI